MDSVCMLLEMLEFNTDLGIKLVFVLFVKSHTCGMKCIIFVKNVND